MSDKKSNLSTNEVCKLFDVTKTTLFKWEKEGKMKKAQKDWRGWRIFSEENVDEIRKIILNKKQKHI